MTVLSDVDLVAALASEELSVTPLAESAIQPNSIDLRLDKHFKVMAPDRVASQWLAHNPDALVPPDWLPAIDPFDLPEDLYQDVVVGPRSKFVINPGQFALSALLEDVQLSASLCARIEGKSSLGRLGLAVHATAGFVDAGWSGQLTLELYNMGTLPIALRPHMFIAQLCVQRLTSPAAKPYGHPDRNSKYIHGGAVGVVGSRYDKNKQPPV